MRCICIITIKRNIFIGSAAVVDGEVVGIGGGEGNCVAPIAHVAASAVGFDAGVIGSFGGKAGEVLAGCATHIDRSGACEVGSGAVFKHPGCLGATGCPVESCNGAVARSKSKGQA